MERIYRSRIYDFFEVSCLLRNTNIDGLATQHSNVTQTTVTQICCTLQLHVELPFLAGYA
jgi:hypothetical protein